MVAKLTIDPSGTPASRTLAYPLIRDWPERERSAYRQDFVSPAGGFAASVARPGVTRPTGTLRLMLSLADRQWWRTHASTIYGGATVRVFFDSTDAATYTDVVVAGADVDEVYQRVFAGRSDTIWTLDVPVLVIQEVVA